MNIHQIIHYIKWHVLKSIRNRIIHDYDGINLEIVWDIVKEDSVELKSKLMEIIDAEKDA